MALLKIAGFAFVALVGIVAAGGTSLVMLFSWAFSDEGRVDSDDS